MLHHHGGAGSPYPAPTTPDAVQFSLPPPPTGPMSFTDMPMPPTQLQPAPGTSAFVELPPAGVAANIHDDDMPADVGLSGTGAGASGSGSTRWPREETLALIRIRSEMDAAFRNAPLKAPLWEDVARKLAALGYSRSAKKCKEKFENVDKYYRRTKESRAGRQDGKSYRFFSELEALHAAAPQRQHQAAATMATVQAADPQPSVTMAWTTGPAALGPLVPSLPDRSFSSMSGSESDSDDEFDDDDDAEDIAKGDGECSKEMMALFEGMMRQVTEKQDAMQRAFLETLEKWESERTAREEAWRLQEVARMNREREQLARERAAAASRDAALIAFLQRQSMRLPPSSAVAVAVPTPMPVDGSPTSPRHDVAALRVAPAPPPKPEEAWAWAVGVGEQSSGSGSASSSRWPKEEVQALIQLRTDKDEKDHDAGSKGPLWEDIAAGMRRIGYNRSAKRCKEKWENINKYFKKVKESNKRRPEDSKTCPYFHQLDAMYRKKRFAGSAGSGTASGALMAAVINSGQASPSQRELEGKISNDVVKQNIVGVANEKMAPTTAATGDDTKGQNAEDTVRETNVQLQTQQQQEFAADETDSDDMEGNYADEGNDADNMQYETGFQKPNVMVGSSGNVPAPTETAAAATSLPQPAAAPSLPFSRRQCSRTGAS
ncbi:hypothetical protein EJB05_52099 [Eragrostis curvula]|uniref:Myb-like domain-containing protein n=1 Tax=Eragrostis curvula TaxID=38414 RepID=A0A5J9STW6_9POAL|nr:hypothetical protein EJB05_52099 [Eragrostis curvula]